MNQLYLLVLVSILLGCSQSEELNLQPVVDDYYKTYAERENFDKFLAFYDSSMVLEDMIFGEKIEGLENFKAFFDWPNPNFELKDSVALVVRDQVIGISDVITSGYFTPFSWGDVEVETMQFTTILTFNKEGKIIKHVDWINYPSYLIDYETRKNSNEWPNNSE